MSAKVFILETNTSYDNAMICLTFKFYRFAGYESMTSILHYHKMISCLYVFSHGEMTVTRKKVHKFTEKGTQMLYLYFH